jgi:hypothetical protein
MEQFDNKILSSGSTISGRAKRIQDKPGESFMTEKGYVEHSTEVRLKSEGFIIVLDKFFLDTLNVKEYLIVEGGCFYINGVCVETPQSMWAHLILFPNGEWRIRFGDNHRAMKEYCQL